MEIYLLRAFVMVARLGNLTRAAETLHVTQPAVTAQIKALEQALGVALFERRPNGLQLTRAGEILGVEAENVLAAMAQLGNRAKSIKGETAGRIAVGTIADPEFLRLGSLITGLMSHMPLVELKTQHGLSGQILAGVLAGSLQGGFYIGDLAEPGINRQVLRALSYRIVAPMSFRKRLESAGWRDLAALPWIGAPKESHLHKLLRDLLARKGLAPAISMETDEVAGIHALVAAGVGLTLMREDLAMQRAEKGELLIWDHARVPTQLSFIYLVESEEDPVLVGLLSVLKQTWNGG